MNAAAAIHLRHFLQAIGDNHRMGPAHISVYVCLVARWHGDEDTPVSVFAKEIMRDAKVLGQATYFKVLRELQECRLIKYEPSFNPAIGSTIYILKCEV